VPRACKISRTVPRIQKSEAEIAMSENALRHHTEFVNDLIVTGEEWALAF